MWILSIATGRSIITVFQLIKTQRKTPQVLPDLLAAVSKHDFEVVDEATSPYPADNAAGLVASPTTKIFIGYF